MPPLNDPAGGQPNPILLDEYQHHTIVTPELVEIAFPLAGVARRF